MKIVESLLQYKHNYLNTKNIDLLLTTVFFIAIFLTAWNNDDAFHGFTMARNFANGDGFVYNIGERVNASTCPLFVLLLGCLYFYTGHMCATSFIVCTAFTTGAFIIAIRSFCTKTWHKLFILIATLTSHCFVSFSNCGLENCMLFFLDTILLYLIQKKQDFTFVGLLKIALVCSAVLMTRMDAMLLLMIPTVYIFLIKRQCSVLKMFCAGLLGLLPFFAWEAFHLFYFGFLFPNTFYSKMNSGYPTIEYVIRGFEYIFVSGAYDLMLLSTIITALIVLRVKNSSLSNCILISFIIRIIYLVRIGGDFMVGRHFTDMFWMSLILLTMFASENEELKLIKITIPAKKLFIISLFAISVLSVYLKPMQNLLLSYESIGEERELYFKDTSLITRSYNMLIYGVDPRKNMWRKPRIALDAAKQNPEAKGKMMAFQNGNHVFAPGEFVFTYNNNFYLSDQYALGDPLLVRLPSSYSPGWRIAHVDRVIPEGYSESIETGENRIVDPSLHKYYDVIRLITRGDLFSKERLQAILDFNIGKYDYLLQDYISRNVDQLRMYKK